MLPFIFRPSRPLSPIFMAENAAVANFPQQQFPPLLSPRFRQFGGASRVSRRFMWRKIRRSVAAPLLPAVPCGDNIDKFAKIANFY